jgi:hypothetical protein
LEESDLEGKTRHELADLLTEKATEVSLLAPADAYEPAEEAPAPELPTASPITPPAAPKTHKIKRKVAAPAPVVEEAPAPAADPDYREEAEFAWESALITEEARKEEFIKLSVRVRELEAQLAKKPASKVADTFVPREGVAYKYEVHPDNVVAEGVRKEMSADEKVNARRAYQRERYRLIYAKKYAADRAAKKAAAPADE